MEPEWMKMISSSSVCNFFYIWFIVYAIFFVLALVLTLVALFSAKKLGSVGVFIGLQSGLTLLIAGGLMLSHYLVCSRALLSGGASKTEALQTGY
jgi:hypothetical protein